MEAGKWELHLRLHTGGTRELAPGCSLRDVVEQCRLADPGLAAQHEYSALPAPGMLELPLQQLPRALPAVQHGPRTIRTRAVTMRSCG
jgi:hypothetical protein